MGGERHLELEVSAPGNTFSDPLYFPTPEGWSNDPGSVESYKAMASVKLFKRSGELLEAVDISQTALEFGGSYRCKQGLSPSAAAALSRARYIVCPLLPSERRRFG